LRWDFNNFLPGLAIFASQVVGIIAVPGSYFLSLLFTKLTWTFTDLIVDVLEMRWNDRLLSVYLFKYMSDSDCFSKTSNRRSPVFQSFYSETSMGWW
jgi:hypothetical protein